MPTAELGLYRTTNIYIAAFLVASGASLPHPELVGRVKPLVEFVWDDKDGRIARLALTYHNHAKVEAKTYTQAVRECRNLITDTTGRA